MPGIQVFEEPGFPKGRKMAFNRLFDAHPRSEDYFKASNARLNFLAWKALELSAEMYLEPTKVHHETTAL